MQFLHETSCYNINEHKDEDEYEYEYEYGHIKSFVTECDPEELDFSFEICVSSIYRHVLGAGDKDSRQLALYTELKRINLRELRKLIESFVDGILEEKKKPLPYSERVKMK